MKNLLTIAAIAGLLGVATLPAGASTSLGAAEDWNAMIFNNLNASSDTEGALAVGGNMTTSGGYSVGKKAGFGPSLPDSDGAKDSLVVGGNLNASNGYTDVFGGNVRVGGTVTGGVGVNPPHITNNQVYANVGAGNVGIDFVAAKADLVARSTAWSQLAQTGSVYHNNEANPYIPWNPYNPPNEIALGGTGDLVVFNLIGDALDQVNRHFFVDPGATVLVNVSGTDIDITGWSWYVNGNGNLQTFANEANIIFNFYEALTLDLNNTTLPGSVLAPNAHLTITGGGINGQTIANSATQIGGGQFNNYSFGGSLPPTGGSGSGTGGATPAVPSPAAVWGGLGLIGSMLLRRRRRG